MKSYLSRLIISYVSRLIIGGLLKVRVSSWYFLCKDRLKQEWAVI